MRDAVDCGASNGGSTQFRALDICGQATKGVWGMSWHQKATKGVEDCDKSGELSNKR